MPSHSVLKTIKTQDSSAHWSLTLFFIYSQSFITMPTSLAGAPMIAAVADSSYSVPGGHTQGVPERTEQGSWKAGAPRANGASEAARIVAMNIILIVSGNLRSRDSVYDEYSSIERGFGYVYQ